MREADYSRPHTLRPALAGVQQPLLVSSSEAGQRVAQHTNVIQGAKAAGTSRIVYTSMLNADDSTSPLAGEHRDSEDALRESGMPFTLLRNGYYTDGYTNQLGQYLDAGQIVGAAATAGSRQLRARTTAPLLPRPCSKTRKGTGRTSLAARHST